MTSHLFRKEALIHLKNRNHGHIFINTPMHYSVLITGLSTLIIASMLFVLFTSFSEKHIVTGYLNFNKGMATVYPKHAGIINKQYVHCGEHVTQGDRLFSIDTSYDGVSEQQNDALYNQLQKRKEELIKEITDKKQYLITLKTLLDKKYISLSFYQTIHDEMVALQHQKHSLEISLIQHQQSRSYIVRAPIDGVISNIMYQTGQYTNPEKPLIDIVPLHSDLIALLYVPITKSGFLNHNERITLRFDAYPYQQFGSLPGKITYISQSILTDHDEDKPFHIKEPYYKMIARLQTQTLTHYGQQHALQQGMTVTAVIFGARKKLWQWIFDPIIQK